MTNSFKAGIFLSIAAPIPKIVNQIDRYVMRENELYIFSANEALIASLVHLYLYGTIYTENGDARLSCKRLMDTVAVVYSAWDKMKKNAKELDIAIMHLMENANVPIPTGGHLYIVPKTKCYTTCIY